MSTKQRLKDLYHKEGVNKDDWDKVHPNLLVLADFVLLHCDAYDLPMTITSIIRPKIKGVSVSNSHADGRSFDISIRGWSEEDVLFLRDQVNDTFHFGALSLRDGLEKEAVYEDGVTAGTAPHLHFQVRP